MAIQEPAAIEPEVIVMAPESIVGHVARAVPALSTLPPQPRDLSEMKCSTWTDLTQGAIGQQVRYCE
jgi:hypothetical protein